jgi:predicted RNA binding protein YcfA (HicA-like mRNA interferase family)
MKARELLRVLNQLGCVQLRQKGSHLRIQCGECFTTVPVHAGEDIKLGTLKSIERQLAPCLGEGWLTKR